MEQLAAEGDTVEVGADLMKIDTSKVAEAAAGAPPGEILVGGTFTEQNSSLLYQNPYTSKTDQSIYPSRKQDRPSAVWGVN